MSTLQWKRSAQLVVGSGGSGLLVQNLRVAFDITKTATPNPNPAIIKVYNLTPEHESQIKEEYTDVLLSAGYLGAPGDVGNVKQIFTGNIKQVFRYREGNDRVCEISCGDGDQDYRTAVVNTTLAAGTTTQDLLSKVLGSFGSTLGGFVGIPTGTPAIRGRVLSGNARQVLHHVAREHGAHWSIQDGRLTIVPVQATLPNQALVVNSQSGLIGTPEINERGLTVSLLLNPDAKVYGVIQLDNDDIQLRVKHSTRAGAKKKQRTSASTRLDPDGLYKMFKVQHKGDTRADGANGWETKVTCMGLSQPIPQSTTGAVATGALDGGYQ